MRQYFVGGNLITSGPSAISFTGSFGNTTLAVGNGNVAHTLRVTAFNAMGGYRWYPGFRGERWALDAKRGELTRAFDPEQLSTPDPKPDIGQGLSGEGNSRRVSPADE
jgi:hypothetical protein